MSGLWSELKRRNVVRVGIAYAVAGWLVLQIVDVLSPLLLLSDAFGRGVLLALVLGLPITLVLAWVYELTPEGVALEKNVDRSESITHVTGRRLDFVIIGVLSVALMLFALDKFVWSASGGQYAAGPVDKSVAVLPFENRSASAQDVHFVDGIHDDVLMQLHKVSGIDKVIASRSTERYRSTDLTNPEIAAELGVATILEGSVQRAGDRVRIAVRLVDARSDEYLWVENFDRELTTRNVFDIQSEIATAIAGQLRSTLTADEAARLSALPTSDLEAYDAYLLGRQSLKGRRLENLRAAERYFRRAIELDPEFALAYAGVADTKNVQAVFTTVSTMRYLDGYDAVAAIIADSAAMARRALELDARSGEVYASLGYNIYQEFYVGGRADADIRAADEYFARAIELSPNSADVHRWYAQLLVNALPGRRDEALAHAERAALLDPLSAINLVMLGDTYRAAGRYEEALHSLDKAREIDPSFEAETIIRVVVLFNTDRYAEAIALARDVLDVAPDAGVVAVLASSSYLQLGATDETVRLMTLARASDEPSAVALVDFIGHVTQGRLEEARRLLADGTVSRGWCSVCYGEYATALVVREDAEALLRFVAEHAPELVSEERTRIHLHNRSMVAPTAWALRETGQSSKAAALIEAGLEFARQESVFTVSAMEAYLHSIAGEHQFAAEAFARAVEGGWRNRLALESAPFLDPIRSYPEFMAAADVVRADIDAQRAWLAEREASGELAPLPR